MDFGASFAFNHAYSTRELHLCLKHLFLLGQSQIHLMKMLILNVTTGNFLLEFCKFDFEIMKLLLLALMSLFGCFQLPFVVLGLLLRSVL